MLLHIDKLREGEGEESYKVVEAAGIPRWDANAKLAVVGQPHPRVEGREKVTGRARYAYDIREPGQLYARVLRSPHPHARLRRVDSSRAEALAGVRAVIHAFNVPEIRWFEDALLFDRELRVVGDEVAPVAADSGATAAD